MKCVTRPTAPTPLWPITGPTPTKSHRPNSSALFVASGSLRCPKSLTTWKSANWSCQTRAKRAAGCLPPDPCCCNTASLPINNQQRSEDNVVANPWTTFPVRCAVAYLSVVTNCCSISRRCIGCRSNVTSATWSLQHRSGCGSMKWTTNSSGWGWRRPDSAAHASSHWSAVNHGCPNLCHSAIPVTKSLSPPMMAKPWSRLMISMIVNDFPATSVPWHLWIRPAWGGTGTRHIGLSAKLGSVNIVCWRIGKRQPFHLYQFWGQLWDIFM